MILFLYLCEAFEGRRKQNILTAVILRDSLILINDGF